MIQKLNAEGRLEKKEAKKGSSFDKVRIWTERVLVFLNEYALHENFLDFENIG